MSQALQLPAASRQERRSSLGPLRKIRAGLAELQRRRRQRAELRRLLKVGPHVIADVGLDCEAARAEVRKPLWEA